MTPSRQPPNLSFQPPERSPVRQKDRVVALDVLRGLAIFGILVVNLDQMFIPLFLAESPVAMIPGEWGTWFAWAFTDVFFTTKFLTIFSLLFGAGFGRGRSRHSNRLLRTSSKPATIITTTMSTPCTT